MMVNSLDIFEKLLDMELSDESLSVRRTSQANRSPQELSGKSGIERVSPALKDIAKMSAARDFLYEDMIRAETPTRICRIWRQQSDDVANIELKQIALTMLQSEDDIPHIVTQLANFARVNSVEVIDRETGDGVCVHVDWP